MNQALSNPDILFEICQQVLPWREVSITDALGRRILVSERKARSTLASCARVSRVFSDPALRVLWRQMDTLLPLFNLLPYLRGERDIIELNGYFTDLADAQVLHDWGRFKLYASHVRSATHEQEESLDDRSFAFLKQLNEGRPLLPSLQELCWEQIGDSGSDIPHFLSPSIRRIFMSVPRSPSTPSHTRSMEQILRAIQLHAPSVTHIHVSDFGRLWYLQPLIRFESLRLVHISTSSLDLPLLLVLPKMTNVVELRLDVDEGQLNSFDNIEGFAALRKLRLTGTLAAFPQCFKVIRPPLLETIHLNSFDTLTPEICRDCLAPLVPTFMATLRNVHILFGKVSGWSQTTPSPLLDFIRPLLGLHGLEGLYLDFHQRWITISDEAVHEMASAWPKLTSLAFYFSYYRQEETQILPSLQSLAEFSQRCPSLRRLRIPIANVDIAPDPHIPFNASHAMKHLNVSGAAFKDIDSVASFIHTIFPNIDTAGALRNSRYLQTKWRLVLIAIAALQMQRHE